MSITPKAILFISHDSNNNNNYNVNKILSIQYEKTLDIRNKH